MGSQFAPASMRRFETLAPEIPTVPFVRINGLLSYKIMPGGWAWSRYYAFDEPDMRDHRRESAKRPCLELLCHLDDQTMMRRMVEGVIADAEPWH